MLAFMVVGAGTMWSVTSTVFSTSVAALKWMVGYQTAEQKRIAELEKRLKNLEEARDRSCPEIELQPLCLSPPST